jgi:hypothetical protein
MISEEMATRTAITQEGVFPLLIAAGNIPFLSAQLWPLDLALVVLDREAPEQSELRRALARMAQAASTPNGQRFTGLRSSIHRLVTRGALMPGGEGWNAGYTVEPEMRAEGSRVLASLGAPDQQALRRAAQALSDATKMVSKNGAAWASGSATI